MTILFPSSYINNKKADEEYEQEYVSAMMCGFDVLLFNQELWDTKRKISIIGNITPSKEEVIYRGWMMKPEDYFLFDNQLNEHGLNLLVTPTEYKNLHVFKNSYPYAAQDAPQTLFYDSVSEIDLEYINKTAGRFMVKDFVKSVKGTDFPKYFECPSKEYFESQMQKFAEYRGDLFTGGIQIKEYLDLKKYGSNTNEYRAFYLNGQVISISRNSNQPMDANQLPDKLIQKYSRLQSSFYTVDYAECVDGSFKVIETGDGGVSGLPDELATNIFYERISEILHIKDNDLYLER